MNKRITLILTVLVLMYGMAGTSEAALYVRGTDTLGNKLIYNDDQDITWYDYSSAQAAWASQVAWAEALSVTFNATVYDDWRLPTAGTTPASGYNQSGPDNEMEHLYYDEGGGGIPAEFSNINAYYYWSGTEYAPNPAAAWTFNFTDGSQGAYLKGSDFYALAVRPGDVSGSAVPELPTGAMQLMVMLLGAGYIRIRKAGFSRYHKNV
ncbi:MAG: DUF1566 domain-containing protein [Candidatus Omnitrophica bacterium]|nr:DUF1566 domain-containing protein [Candidatus Omnitrophota bacterium]